MVRKRLCFYLTLEFEAVEAVEANISSTLRTLEVKYSDGRVRNVYFSFNYCIPFHRP